MQQKDPQIIGIAGGSCAGKSWLAERLVEGLRDKAARISLDDFYLDRSYLSPARRARLNFDHPRSIDWPRFESALRLCANQEAFSVPRYDFSTHSRVREESRFSPVPVVIVDGLWLFRRAALRDLFTLKIFIRSSLELSRSRRLERDTRERNRTPAEICAQLERFTLPMFTRFVAPQERWADLVLDAPVSGAALSDLLNRIAENFCGFGI